MKRSPQKQAQERLTSRKTGVLRVQTPKSLRTTWEDHHAASVIVKSSVPYYIEVLWRRVKLCEMN